MFLRSSPFESYYIETLDALKLPLDARDTNALQTKSSRGGEFCLEPIDGLKIGALTKDRRRRDCRIEFGGDERDLKRCSQHRARGLKKECAIRKVGALVAEEQLPFQCIGTRVLFTDLHRKFRERGWEPRVSFLHLSPSQWQCKTRVNHGGVTVASEEHDKFACTNICDGADIHSNDFECIGRDPPRTEPFKCAVSIAQ